jgi:beta-N-acetylhexosaminidase
MPWAMTAHVVYEALDPAAPATTSSKVVGEVIRGEIGFDGLLISDDLDMKALEGDPADLAAQVVEAGCDIALNCWGRLDEMERTVDRLGEMPEASRNRLARALAKPQESGDNEAFAALIDKRDRLLSLA